MPKKRYLSIVDNGFLITETIDSPKHIAGLQVFKKPKNAAKSFVKKHLLTLDNGQYKWESLQGLVYGKFIHYAEIFPGVVNFLAHCQRRGHKVLFVSHKTEFGHYDKSKTSLRKAALNFLEENNFFSDAYGIKKKDVYFSNTRQCKVDKISELNCDYFIDDLLEVFEEPHFPKKTKRILFNNKAQSVDWSFNSWYKINAFFFKKIEYWGQDANAPINYLNSNQQ